MAAAHLPGQVDVNTDMNPSVVQAVPAVGDQVPKSQNPEPELVTAMIQEQQRVCDFITTWTAQQNALWKEHAARNEQLMSSLVGMHLQTLQNLKQLGKSAGCSETEAGQADLRAAAAVAGPPQDVALSAEEQPKEAVNGANGLEVKVEAEQKAKAGKRKSIGDSQDVVEELEALDKDSVLLDAWRRSSGMHTVEKWVKNYRKHPGAWGALLMIHGVPEVTGRLRTKVENYAIYSALFLSVSIALAVDPPNSMTADNPNNDWSFDWWLIEIRRRAYFYGLGVGTGAHMLSILLGMTFVNALNETGRDSDVFRLFSRGKGFLATVKCQQTFRAGCVADYLAMAVAATAYVHWAEVLILGSALVVIAARTVSKTSRLLFSNGSLVRYWRKELGGNPDADDPYDLNIPQKCFERRANTNHNLFHFEHGLFNIDDDPDTPGVQNDLFNDVRNNVSMPTETKSQPAGGSSQQAKTGVAAIF